MTQRPIKFRAWNGYHWWYEIYLNSDGKVFLNGKVLEWPVVFSTGLHDKNGKDVWESDKVKTPAGVGVVEWRDGCFRICWNEKDATTLHDTKAEHIEVIGNIYENSELLK